jgi:hypothetical protein
MAAKETTKIRPWTKEDVLSLKTLARDVSAGPQARGDGGGGSEEGCVTIRHTAMDVAGLLLNRGTSTPLELPGGSPIY